MTTEKKITHKRQKPENEENNFNGIKTNSSKKSRTKENFKDKKPKSN